MIKARMGFSCIRCARLAALPFAFLLVSCATVQSGGFTVRQGFTEDAFEKVKSRATFDLECPKEKLELVVLGTGLALGGDVPTQIGVSGCSHKAVYVSTSLGWVMNNAGEKK
jgi:hypothetical protein